MSRSVFKARWVVPGTFVPVENGRLVVETGRIAAVESATGRGRAVTDLGDVALLPGFVNAHTHLELSFCHRGAAFTGSFVEWLESLISLQAQEAADTLLRRSIRDGVRHSLAAGVTALGDVGGGLRGIEEWSQAAIHIVGFLEVLGMGPKRFADHERSVRRAARLCERGEAFWPVAAGAQARGSLDGSSGRSLRRLGISPHAPYSTDPSVYRGAIEFALRTGRPICTHLAETREESAFLAGGTGPFRELLERRRLWDGSFDPPACSPVEYAQQLGLLACRPLLAHLNYVTDADLDLLARSSASVAYCPRTHRFFQHDPHRYRDMLLRGINVCIGTDSLASSDSLSVLDELRFLRRQDQTGSGEGLLAMGTIAGARALELDAEVGSLEAGKRADFVTVPLCDPSTADPIADLLSGDSKPSAVYFGGAQVHPL